MAALTGHLETALRLGLGLKGPPASGRTAGARRTPSSSTRHSPGPAGGVRTRSPISCASARPRLLSRRRPGGMRNRRLA
jgi:hypothetical protein